MKRSGYSTILIVGSLTVCMAAGVSLGQVASSLLNEGDPATGLTGHNVSTIQSPAVNHVGGWAINVNSSDGTETLSSAWGTVDGVTAPAVIFYEATYPPYVQTSWEYQIGLSDTGSVGYSATGTGGPDDGFDSMWVDGTWYALEGEPCPAGPLAGLYWRFASAPLLSGNNIPHFVGGTTNAVGGSTKEYGLFDATGTPVVYAGDQLPGLPAILDTASQIVDFDYGYSGYGNSWIAPVKMETTDTPLTSSTDNAMVIDGQGLYIDGMIVQEDQPIPASIGGLVDENWDNFDSTAINEMGEYIFTGDSTAATSEDEFIVVNGMIVAREGAMLDGVFVNGAIESAYINENGDWAAIWDYDHPTEGNIEALFFNGQYMLGEKVDDVDMDGDGNTDAGARLTGTAFSGTRALKLSDRDPNGNVSIFFTADVSDNGASAVEGFYRMIVPTTPGADGDLEIYVTDSPDPLSEVPGQITYAVRVRNNSPYPATGVNVVTTIDPMLVFNGALSDPIAVHDGSPSGGDVTANIGNMDPYDIVAYRFVVDADSGPTVTSVSVLSGNEPDTVPGNNTYSNDTLVALITDLSVTVTDDPDPVILPNGSIVYTVEVANAGPSDASGVMLTMNLDPTTTFNAGLSDPAAIHGAGVVTIDVGGLTPGSSEVYVIGVDTTVQGLLSAEAIVYGNEVDPDETNNTAVEETLYQLSTDLYMTIKDAPDPVIPVGGEILYTVEVINDGPSDATGVNATVYLDDTTNFVSVSAPGAYSAGMVTMDVGDLAVGEGYVFDVIVETTAAGRPVAIGEVAGGGTETDPDPLNNEVFVNTLVIDNAAGLSTGIFSNLAEHTTAKVPDLPEVQFTGTACDRPSRTPDGSKWIIACETTVDEVIIVGNECKASTMVQEGVSALDMGDTVGPIDSNLSINNEGQFVFATNTDAATSMDEAIVKWDGNAFVTIAREGDYAAPTTFNYGSVLHSANIDENGRVWFVGDTDGGSDYDYFVFKKNGNTVAIQEGVSVPANQAGGATEAWDNFDTDDLWVDAGGVNYIVQGDLEGDYNYDDIAAVNNNVMIQEGSVLAGTAFDSPADMINECVIVSNGDWFARGDNEDDQDWVLKNGDVIALTGDPLYPGSVEIYDDAAYGACFYIFAGNNEGDYIIGGVTNSGEDHSNAALVLNGEVVIAREHDPIDLDGNGIMDDGVRINTFGNDDLVLTDDLQAYFTVTMRDYDDEGANDIGDAFLHLNLCNVATVCGDLDNDKDVDVQDYNIFLDAFGKSTCDAEYHICADYDGDGMITLVDYQAWLACYREFVDDPLAEPPTVVDNGEYERESVIDSDEISGFHGAADIDAVRVAPSRHQIRSEK